MLSERDIEAAHPDAFDFVFGNLPAAKRAEFNRHLAVAATARPSSTSTARSARSSSSLPPHVEPPADLEDRTVAAMVAALAGRGPAGRRPDPKTEAATRVYPIPDPSPGRARDSRSSQFPSPGPGRADTGPRPSPVAQPTRSEPQARPMVTRLPVWRRYRGRLAAVSPSPRVIAAAIVIPLSLAAGTRARPRWSSRSMPPRPPR